MIEKDHNRLSVVQQCDLLTLHRSGLYYRPCPESEENLAIMRLLDEQYFKTPFYGIRRLTAWLQETAAMMLIHNCSTFSPQPPSLSQRYSD